MSKNIDDIIKRLPVERRAKIAALSQQKVEEMMLYAKNLADVRKAFGKTQAEVAKVLGIKQHGVSQLEKRSDTYVSTLRRFLGSLGMKLELSVVAKNGARIDLPNFLVVASAKTPAKTGSPKTKMAFKPVASKPTGRVSKSASSTAKKKTHSARKNSSVLQNA